jgi:hypothetical protein
MAPLAKVALLDTTTQFGVKIKSWPSAPREVNMRGYVIRIAAAGLMMVLAAAATTAQDPQDKDKSSGGPTPWYKSNPLKLINRGPKSANDQLASDGHLEDNLTKQLRLQGVLASDRELQDVCSDFKELATCVAVLRLSVSLPVEFSCLKWNVTAVKPKLVADSCAGPSGGKAMTLDKAVDLLKPGPEARTATHAALKKAHDDIKDARS